MSEHLISADSLRNFVQQVFLRAGYPSDQSADATDVLMWASLRGVDTHGVRNLKSYYVDRTRQGQLRPRRKSSSSAQTPHAACLDGDSGLGLACACRAMRMAIDNAQRHGVGMVCVRNTHHLGPAGYFAHMAVEHGMLGVCTTGHFFGQGNSIGIAPLGSLLADVLHESTELRRAVRSPSALRARHVNVRGHGQSHRNVRPRRAAHPSGLGVRRRRQFDH